MSEGRSLRFLRIVEAPGPVAHYTTVRLSGREAISELFSFTLDVETLSRIPPPESYLGQPVGFYIGSAEGDARYISGLITRCTVLTRQTDYVLFRLSVSPALWPATIRQNCKVFQNRTVKEVVAAVLKTYPDLLFDDSGVTGGQARLPLITQFYETDYNFVTRLLEREGVYFYFRHDPQLGGRVRHRMVMSDSRSGYFGTALDTVRYEPNDNAFRGVRQLSTVQANHPARFSLHDYEYRAPMTRLDVNQSSRNSWADGQSEVYLYPGGYRDRATGARIVQIAAEREEAAAEQLEGSSDVQLLEPGMRTRIDHPLIDDAQRQVVVLAVEHHSVDTSLSSYQGTTDYTNSFTALPAARTYRPPLRAQRTTMHGPQTGLVVGPKREEIHCDDLGRIRVRYQWDRDDEKLGTEGSFWCRVAQPWAGNGFGAQFLPRVGMEVLIDFVGGDPDRPLVIGCLYNGVNRVPHALPANRTRTVIRSRSSPGGGTCNELVFEDKAQHEKLSLFAGRDSERTVQHDERITIGNERSVTIAGSEQYEVKQSERVRIGTTLHVDAGQTIDMTAGERITLRVGGSSITIDNAGVRIDGPRIDYTSSGPLSIRSDVHAQIQAPVTNIQGGALTTVQAPLVKIN